MKTPDVIDSLRHRYAALHRQSELIPIEVPLARVPLADAVRSYLFNSQLVTVGRGRMALIAPQNCPDTPSVKSFIHDLLSRGRTPLCEGHCFDLKESMRNGGGPACLRLRVVLAPAELAALPPRVLLTETNCAALVTWVKKHDREKLTAADLADPARLIKTRRALDELTALLGLGSIYPLRKT